MVKVSQIYFTDVFEVEPAVVEAYGAFDISLINDLPLFIDPFLLFDSTKPEYKALHEEIIRYVTFLRDRSLEEHPEGVIAHWFMFPEVKQNWLGFSKTGNKGTGLGPDFASSLRANLRGAFKDFGKETISRGSHLEKLCLIEGGVGRDHISDFVANLTKGFLLEYSQRFAREHLSVNQRKTFALDKVTFDYSTGRWRRGRFELPTYGGDYVLLTPKDILTRDESWICRSDLIDRFRSIYPALLDVQLRDQVGVYFMSRLGEKPSARDFTAAAAAAVARYPEILDHYISQKEGGGYQAHRVSAEKVGETEAVFITAIRKLVEERLDGTEFYRAGDSFDESLKRVHFLKDVIENKDGYRIFYVKGSPLEREADLQIMFRLTWYGSPLDVNREVNNGRGPVDFKASHGAANATLVEFKLASNRKLDQNLKHQVAAYEAASDTAKSIKAILFFSESEYSRVAKILKALGLEKRRDVVLIDARNDNKPSASTIRD